MGVRHVRGAEKMPQELIRRNRRRGQCTDGLAGWDDHTEFVRAQRKRNMRLRSARGPCFISVALSDRNLWLPIDQFGCGHGLFGASRNLHTFAAAHSRKTVRPMPLEA